MYEHLAVGPTQPVRVLVAGSERRINVTIVNVGQQVIELLDDPHGEAGSGFPLIPGAEWVSNCSGRAQLWAIAANGVAGSLAVSRVVAERDILKWGFKGPVDDMMLARLPFYEAQEALRGARQSGTARFASCEWHGASQYGDPERTSFAMVDESGPLGELVGERIVVSFEGRQVYAYVHRSTQLDAEMSLNRRAFMALAPLSADALSVAIAVVL
jgi:hypothetical protein